jgi:hypothetical protein
MRKMERGKGLFKGFNRINELTMDTRLMCAILGEELAKAGMAIETMSEEIKDLRNKIDKLEQNKE